VNKEVKVFNRKLRKEMKIFENTILIKVDPWVALEYKGERTGCKENCDFYKIHLK
jgi:hypothetical protein